MLIFQVKDMLKPIDYIISEKKNFKTVMEMLQDSCKRYSNKNIMQMKVNGVYQSYTYGEFWERINYIAKALRRNIFLPSERGGIYSENRPEWGMAYFGIVRCGGIVVPLDAQLNCAELEYILNHSKTKVIFTSRKCLENVKEIFNNLKSLKKIVCFDEVPEENHLKLFNTFLLIGQKAKFPIFHVVRPNHVIEILYTSGTTGIAKGVMLTQSNIISDVEGMCQMHDFSEKDTFLSVLPIHHAFEGTAGFMTPIYNGASITYAESLRSKNIIDNIRETNVTLMLGVPLLYEKLYNGIKKAVKEEAFLVQILFHLGINFVKFSRKLMNKKIGKEVFNNLREKAGLKSIRFFVSGGGPLRHDIAEAFDDFGLTVVQGYGLTETSPVLTVSTLKYNNYYSVGLPVPGNEIKIDNPDKNNIGEIIVKGPIVMKGYYKNKKATKEVLKKGWLYTGDEGHIDEQGFVYITGRKKNIIVTQGGKNVFPEEIEEKLNECEFILESMIYGLPVSERDKGEKVYAIIVPDYETIEIHGKRIGIHYDTEEKVEKLIKNEVNKVNVKLPIYKKITGFRIHQEELVKTSTKKIKRYLYLEKLVKI